MAAHSHDEVDPVGLPGVEIPSDQEQEWSEGVIVAYEGVCIELLPSGESMITSATPKPQVGDWMFRRITDYWNPHVGAIEAAGHRLEHLDEPARQAALGEIRDAVTEHVRVLDDEMLLRAACIFAEDL